ncbi:hypothetical protein H671_2g5700 [Cricetulus griseus]|nr:hypothetical protein H671_2g5700 [Cricetulus griseus]
MITDVGSSSVPLSSDSAVINATAKEASLPVAAGSSMEHGSYTSTRFPVVAWTMDINTVSVGSMDHGHQPGFQHQQEPWPLTLPPVAARTEKVFRGHLSQKTNHSPS